MKLIRNDAITEDLVLIQDIDEVRVLTLNHPNLNNPFSYALEQSIIQALQDADEDEGVKSVVVTGGLGRSFSAGGDFNEVKKLSEPRDIDAWIDRVIALYSAVLKVSKPTVAAIDNHAIGMGFQFALMFDVKVAAASSKFIMPELKHGIGCSVGAAILNFTSGHNLMKNIVYNCEEISAERANTLHLVDHVVESDVLENFALEQARTLAAYPSVAFEKTKQSINKAFIHVMEAAKSESKRVHRASFGAKSAQKHFANILGNKY